MSRTILDNKKEFITNLYYDKKLSIREISEYLKVSVDATTFFFRKHKIKRRTQKEAQYEKFLKSRASFTKKVLTTFESKELKVIGTMLYWAEGFKGNESSTYHAVDFANSDKNMISIFMKFMRSTFNLTESKFRVLLYCYSDQDINKLINFWSKVTNIPRSQFSKPYVRSDFRIDGRKMKYGMIHVRYSDKRLLLELKNMIESYVVKYAPVG